MRTTNEPDKETHVGVKIGKREFMGPNPSKFEVRNSTGELELQLSFGMVLFFERDMLLYGKQLLAIWNDLLDWRGRDAFSWARIGGGNKSRKMDAASYRTIESWLNGTKSYGRTCWINVQGGNWEEIGPHAMAIDGRDASDDQVSALCIRLPLSVLQEQTTDALVTRLLTLANHLDFLCGTAGFMLHATPFGRQRLWPEMKKLVVRYEGVEPDMVEDGEYTASLGLTGINWLTFVGAKHLERLGGANAVKKAAMKSSDVTVFNVGNGLALRAGKEPHLGDTKKKSNEMTGYRETYEMVKSAIFADPKYAFDKEYFNGRDTVSWTHRFMKT